MKKYDYVKVQLKNNVVYCADLSDHRKVIDDYAGKGYRYAGFLPTKIGPSGKIVEMDLIFETEA